MENGTHDAQDAVRINLDSNEAAVLLELLSRWSESKVQAIPDHACFESTAECAVLNNVLYRLEEQLVALFKPDCSNVLGRNALAFQWGGTIQL